ncbi:histone-lysine N-methyltransferase TRX1 [Elaeis guineensis]|uniref:Histone-lysine N-methyltransferase TRX1 n=1 Tax=Elaeis guineensis var. tenera TaxID=51953 RepID=A0A6J0PMA8_ELAGV|nr:histone-lysine N-methyltransferase TRX1 [Elaeis guineensis]XP_019707936.1 histone-lysine N-methyltransferase TRX1 [Elaeis guineensis]XP_029122088.1 histone-lysine N-methyltransferase TRX1 [Elaeis guineensis]XP_029122089.1 histone-lysine N-methyltransferase TRX1 [Elaeis guineensis]XP_029122090.1 histone-lysine N-methyltransferase TRX1 [Elaeis guineensis]XP_029122091.1 histone-lysine N-methyltransferase TRX1 [Elaeis guineensis]XP_029122092.1 histone-lysine N-methyltransferase TRX1 [Elaeis gu
MALAMESFIHEEEEVDHPVRYLPLGHVYSATPCINPSGSSNVMSKKVKARKLVEEGEEEGGRGEEEDRKKPLDLDRADFQRSNAGKPILVYHRRVKKPRPAVDGQSSFDSLAQRLESRPDPAGNWGGKEMERGDGDRLDLEADLVGEGKNAKKRSLMKYELLRLGDGSGSLSGVSGPRLRGTGGFNKTDVAKTKKRVRDAPKDLSGPGKGKRWVELDFEGADPQTFVGLACKVFWPMDDDWYRGSVTGYNSTTKQHRVEYDDDDVEYLILSKEKIKFQISCEEMQKLNLKCGVHNMEKKALNYNELLGLAVSFHDCQDLEPGDLVWAKLTGHAMWPAVVVNESNVGASQGLKPVRVDKSVLVQFFGTHDFARIKLKNAIPFLNGLLSSLHLKCKQARFHRSLDEAKMYLSKQELPKTMLLLQKSIGADECDGASEENEEETDSCEDLSGDETTYADEHNNISPIEIGNLRVTRLGKIICNSEYFHNKQHIWPVGYTAFRKFMSIKDPSIVTSYKMEVLRNPKLKSRPLFRVTADDGEQIDGPTPTACWKEIYSRIRNKHCDGFNAEVEGSEFQKSGSYMFGFSNPQISQLIQELPNSRLCSKYFESSGDVPAGYRPVRVNWKDLDRCIVCDMDEEYEDNLFLQCDKCRMMVHARCYGELEPLDGVLWLCNLCRPGAPKFPPRCCLCPVIGGAIKPTTDGRWAHLTCAMWIPETCLLDVKRMEPIDGISRINKDRWKLLCSICGVSYGACIQCSHNTCCVAYHPLCARAAGLCVELEDEDKIHLMSLEDDDQCIRLLSFCKKHRQPSNERPPADDSLALPAQFDSSYVPASNPSGCARSEPYNFSWRRGQKQPQVLAAASVKRLFIENKPYLVSGYRQNGLGCGPTSDESFQTTCLFDAPKLGTSHREGNISSMAEKYKNMKGTFRKRLAFGKSRIHGFGVFAKLAHKAGDMVIEYIGELVRPPIADIREHRIYNSLVGAGTYMFRIDDERVIDATRAGSIAHLINHSCEPNCYSRVISVNGDEHIIIFAKRDIKQWEELTYDYRFFSMDKQLACYCGFPRCRGVVNDIEAEEQAAKIRVPRCDLVQWKGE